MPASPKVTDRLTFKGVQSRLTIHLVYCLDFFAFLPDFASKKALVPWVVQKRTYCRTRSARQKLVASSSDCTHSTSAHFVVDHSIEQDPPGLRNLAMQLRFDMSFLGLGM